MNTKVNISRLAEYCNVSESTISRVFNEKSNVKEETRAQILAAARLLNYSPQQTARRETVPIIAESYEHLEPPSWFSTLFVNSLMHEIDKAGYIPRIFTVNELSKIKPKFTMAGIVAVWTPNDELINSLEHLGIQLVWVGGHVNGINSVTFDSEEESEMSVHYLVERGHSRIMLLELQTLGWGQTHRRLGFETAMRKHGISPDEWICDVTESKETGNLSLERLANVLQEKHPTAIICLHEDWAPPLCHMLQKLGLKIGEDISVITSEIPYLSQWLGPGMTTIFKDYKQLAAAVIDQILMLRDRPEMANRTINQLLKTTIVERNSVRNLLDKSDI